jgi:hypothetical protein
VAACNNHSGGHQCPAFRRRNMSFLDMTLAPKS